ncbi:MAG: PorV/PorQ family protein [Candidatus Zixiibacteriota bacterium]
MRMKKRAKTTGLMVAVFLLAVLSLSVAECTATDDASGTCGAQFLKLGLGGRAAGMGGAFIGVADDASAIYWNPGGLATIHQAQLGFTHVAWFQDVSYESFAQAQPFGRWGVIGWSAVYLHMGDLKGRDQRGEPTSDFTSSDLAVTLGYGHKVAQNLFFGACIKYLNEKIEDQNADALAFDIGCLYQTPIDGLSFGGAVQNWGQDVKFVNEGFGLPVLYKLGASYRRKLAENPLTLSMDVCHPPDDRTSLHWGAEYTYANAITGRVGYQNGSDLGKTAGLSFGLGLTVTKAKTYGIDYAFVPQGPLGNSHTISLLVRL